MRFNPGRELAERPVPRRRRQPAQPAAGPAGAQRGREQDVAAGEGARGKVQTDDGPEGAPSQHSARAR